LGKQATATQEKYHAKGDFAIECTGTKMQRSIGLLHFYNAIFVTKKSKRRE